MPTGFSSINEYREFLKEKLNDIEKKIQKAFEKYDKLNEDSIRQDERQKMLKKDMENLEDTVCKDIESIDKKEERNFKIFSVFNVAILLAIVYLIIQGALR